MSQNSSKTPPVDQQTPGMAPDSSPEQTPDSPRPSLSLKMRIFYILGLPAWVFLGFMLAQALVVAIVSTLSWAGVPLSALNPIVVNSMGGAIIYGLAILLVLGVPWLVKKRQTNKKEIGLHRLPNWMDIAWTPAGLIVYWILTAIATLIAANFLTFVDYEQAQETGFALVASQFEYVLAFISLVIVAPFAEEVLFRGYLFGKLQKYTSVWLSILITSLLFAVVHFQWNVGIDVFVLSIVLCLLRIVSGSLWPAILLHMVKNGVAFYFLFINPSLLSTLGG